MKEETMIYCVEDDESIRELMIYTLKTAGYEAEGFKDSEGFWSALKKDQPELIMLDIMLPGEDGISILKKLRANPKSSGIPVIMCTAKGTEYDKVIGLDLGADDYLVKPFGMMEMVSRIKALLRRVSPKTKTRVYEYDGLRLDKDDHTVTLNGERISLTLKEYEMLCLFMENPGRVYTREQLLSSVWETDYIGETRTVDVHVGTLRTKVGSFGKHIETVRGVGYRLEIDK